MHYNYFIIIGFIISFFLFYKFPILPRNNKKLKYNISIVIPARNEENNIDNLLCDLKNQDCIINEILCVDDNSTDKTSEIIKKHNVKYIFIDEVKKGWRGKNWACQIGGQNATGDLLIFIDADVRLDKNAISSLVSAYDKNRNPISVQPYHIVKKQYEMFSFFFNLIQICSTSLSIFRAKKTVGFYGPVFLVQKDMFLKLGGYEGVKDKVVEDLHLGKLYKNNNIDIELFLGGDLIKFRMYPKGIAQLIEGWSKNFSQASFAIDLKLFLMIFFWVGYLGSLPIEMGIALSLKSTSFLIGSFILYIITVIKLNNDIKKIGSYPIYVSILFPFYLLIFFLIFVYSLFSTFLFRNTTWKGRKL
ncbi:MAG: glycosyltransferase [Pleomorphochaeta sp.]